MSDKRSFTAPVGELVHEHSGPATTARRVSTVPIAQPRQYVHGEGDTEDSSDEAQPGSSGPDPDEEKRDGFSLASSNRPMAKAPKQAAGTALAQAATAKPIGSGNDPPEKKRTVRPTDDMWASKSGAPRSKNSSPV